MRLSLTRALGVLTAGTVLVSGAAVLGAQPASALGSPTSLLRASWSYTDSRAPHDSLGGGDSPTRVGSWRDADGKHHTSKAYFTFDLSEFTDRQILDARVVGTETRTNDCNKPGATELWTVSGSTQPTWANQPVEETKLAGPTVHSCVWNSVLWDATELVRSAVADGRTSLRLALRVSEEHQGDVSFGRYYNNGLRINIRHNSRPATPSVLRTNGMLCTDVVRWNTEREVQVSASVQDPDRDELSVQFQLWPMDNPDAMTDETITSSSGSRPTWVLREGALEHDRTYAWRVRASDAHFTSAWTDECRFTNDFVSPSAPSVSSEDYPDDGDWHDGAGLPGEFTFDANGVEDVVAFWYSPNSLDGSFTEVAAEAPGGAATVTYTPEKSGPNRLAVRSVDRSGRLSDVVYYEFYVAQTAPGVEGSEFGYVGQEFEYTFFPNMPGVVSYTYIFQDGPETTVAAGEDGNATVTVRPTRAGGQLKVWSTTGDGRRSGTTTLSPHILDEPEVSSTDYPEDQLAGGVGLPGTFRFTTYRQDVIGYSYCISGPELEQCDEASAGPDGTAEISFTPSTVGYHAISVYVRGQESNSDPTSYTFEVAGEEEW